MDNKKKMTEEEEIIWARDLGCFYSIKDLHPKAIEFFERVFELNELDGKPRNPFVLFRYSQSKRALALPEEALIASSEALEKHRKNVLRGLEVLNCLYELNRLEDTYAHGYNTKRIQFGVNALFFHYRLEALLENFEDSCGESYLGFLCLNKDAVFESHRLHELSKIIDDRPLWKIQKALGNCDVLSILEKEEVLLCPREAARRKRAVAVFTQYYLGQSSKDLYFLNQCLRRDSLLLHYSKEITPLLHKIISHSKRDVNKYLGMLHCRNPLYNVNYRKFSRPGQAYAYTELTLNQVQNLTRRTMQNILRKIKTLKKQGDLKKLSEVIEEEMGDVIAEKTLRVMPVKFEFYCEVYNHLALAYLEIFERPITVDSKVRGKHRLFALFKLTEDETKPIVKQFGDKTTYIEEIKNQEANAVYKKYLSRMEKRLLCAKYPIEKSYIYYQISHKHLGIRSYDMCKIAAGRGLKEAKHCNSIVWQLLNLLEMSKSDVCLSKNEILKDNFNIALALAQQLKNPNLCTFVNDCLQSTLEELFSIKKNKVDKFRSTLSGSSLQTKSSSN